MNEGLIFIGLLKFFTNWKKKKSKTNKNWTCLIFLQDSPFAVKIQILPIVSIFNPSVPEISVFIANGNVTNVAEICDL